MRILIIEDDATIAANLYDYLESKGHAADAAADGVTGLHLAVAHPFDAIILDVGLLASTASRWYASCARKRSSTRRC